MASEDVAPILSPYFLAQPAPFPVDGASQRDCCLIEAGIARLPGLPNSFRKGLKRPLLPNQESVTTMILDWGNSTATSTEHLNGLHMLALKVNRLALECWFLFFDFCFRQIKPLTEGQASPASLDHFEKADGDNILRPRLF
jgi:hypothetical protein